MWVAIHACSLAAFVWLSSTLYGPREGVNLQAIAALWLLAGGVAAVSIFLWALPARSWSGLIRTTGNLWLYAAAAAILASLLTGLCQLLWQAAAELTFRLVQIILRPLLPVMTVEPGNFRIRGSHFSVVVNQECSGLEGASLILVFGAVWLWLFRRELRFPRSFLLLPAGVVILYLSNAFRIAALMLIGEAGARQIAAGGFHSQAGWILFNGVALGLSVSARRIPWFTVRRAERHTENMTAVYLLPFLAVLAAGMISRATTATFEWAYPLRLVAAGIALFVFRWHYRKMDWRSGSMGPLAGIAVFALWISLDWFRGVSQSGMPVELAAASTSARTTWIVLRALAAIVTVPIVEELAFRGYLMRRLSGREFEEVSLQDVNWVGITISSLAFGVMHGDRWVAGSVSGILYSVVGQRSGRIGEVVVAHAVTNALLAATVLLGGNWQYW